MAPKPMTMKSKPILHRRDHRVVVFRGDETIVRGFCCDRRAPIQRTLSKRAGSTVPTYTASKPPSGKKLCILFVFARQQSNTGVDKTDCYYH
mmetsp:Transcript_21329/g.44908  ORF Transcript_21329/g.44908 Transcript_21329/m.44908 type:complete len:92 (-) Transcript_21329:1354-1629(-)